MKKSPWMRDTRPKLVYLNTWSINHIILRTTWKMQEKHNDNRYQTRLLTPTFTCNQRHATLASVPRVPKLIQPLWALPPLLPCTDAALAYCPFSGKRINRARDAVVEADHVIMSVPCSSAAPVQHQHQPSAKKKKKNTHNTAAPDIPEIHRRFSGWLVRWQESELHLVK